MDEHQNVARLGKIFEIKGGLRLNQEYHISVSIDPNDWGTRVKRSSIEGSPLSIKCEAWISALDHVNVILAARSRLDGYELVIESNSSATATAAVPRCEKKQVARSKTHFSLLRSKQRRLNAIASRLQIISPFIASVPTSSGQTIWVSNKIIKIQRSWASRELVMVIAVVNGKTFGQISRLPSELVEKPTQACSRLLPARSARLAMRPIGRPLS